MADAQLQLDEKVKASLLETDDGFRQLVQAHHDLDEQIARLTRLSHLSDNELYEEAALKKRKLALKDRIETIVRAHVAPSAHAAQHSA